ncbi:MAG: DUF58 domain-containing protein [Chloroflexota bacterium]|nr:DUF58 domain-containing protein [Chloroflexota bacterium]
MNRRWYYLGIGIILASLLFRQPLLLVVGILVLCIIGMTDIWEIYCLRNVSYQRRFSEQRVLFGEQVTLSLSVENAKILPLPWLEIEETLPRALTLKDQHIHINFLGDTTYLNNLFSLRWYERITRKYIIQCNARGVHKFGPAALASGDIFGFFSRHESLDSLHYLLVYPLIVPLESFQLPARYPFGERRAPRRLLEDPSRVIGIRDYAYGDSLRRVHWKATARTMQMQSKVYEATTTYTLVTFLNITSHFDTTYGYGLQPDMQELAICAAASITDWALNEGYATGLYANTLMFLPEDDKADRANRIDRVTDDQQLEVESVPVSTGSPPLSVQPGKRDFAKELQRRRVHIPPASNEEQRQRILETLARIQPFFGNSIEDILQKERAHLPAGSTVVVITTTISDGLLDILTRIKQAGHAVTLLFVGDVPLPAHLAGLTVYHLGGQSTWKHLETTYGNGSLDETSRLDTSDTFSMVDKAVGFRL